MLKKAPKRQLAEEHSVTEAPLSAGGKKPKLREDSVLQSLLLGLDKPDGGQTKSSQSASRHKVHGQGQAGLAEERQDTGEAAAAAAAAAAARRASNGGGEVRGERSLLEESRRRGLSSLHLGTCYSSSSVAGTQLCQLFKQGSSQRTVFVLLKQRS